MKPIKVVEMEAEKNENFELGDVLKVYDALGISFYMIVKNELGQYQILDLSDNEIFSEQYDTPKEVVASIFSKMQDIDLFTIEKIVAKPK